MALYRIAGLLVLAAVLSACGQREEILEGERFGVREALLAPADAATDGNDAAAGPEPAPAPELVLPEQTANADWTQKGGNAAHYIANPALGAELQPVWSTSIGAGETRKHRISADPIVAENKIFTLDARSQVRAISTGGNLLWSADLTPGYERNQDASGGGLAYGAGMVFATSGFGALTALDAETGDVLWTQDTDAVVSSAPAYADGLVYVVSRNNVAWAINADNGRVRWQLPGTPSPSGMVGGAAPLVTGRTVVFPFGSSELVAALRKSGIRVWGTAISGQRRGRVYASVTDITGDPVLVGDRIYAATQSGRSVALSAASGERIWTAEEGAYSPVYPAGSAVFLVSDEARLIRLDAETGSEVWAVELPNFTRERERRRKAVFAHFGPVLAGGRLVVASDDGLIRYFSPDDGSALGTLAIRGGAASDPVIADGTLYVISKSGQLHAFR